jgi:hypothetical protein
MLFATNQPIVPNKCLTLTLATLSSKDSRTVISAEFLDAQESSLMIDSGFQDVAGLATKLLKNSGVSSIRDLKVCVQDDHLHLYGRVESYYLKQLAQETIRSATRNFSVVNAVEVLGEHRIEREAQDELSKLLS